MEKFEIRKREKEYVTKGFRIEKALALRIADISEKYNISETELVKSALDFAFERLDVKE